MFTHPVVAVSCWAINFYVWHIPALYQAALRHDALHALEHATFLGFGIAVWMGLLGPLPKPQWFGNGARLVYIIAVRLIGTVLANVMIFSGTVFYPYYHAGDAHWHISSMADQISAARGDDGRGEPADDRPVLLAVPEGRARGRGAPAAARLRGRPGDRAGRAPRAPRSGARGAGRELWERLARPARRRDVRALAAAGTT